METEEQRLLQEAMQVTQLFQNQILAVASKNDRGPERKSNIWWKTGFHLENDGNTPNRHLVNIEEFKVLLVRHCGMIGELSSTGVSAARVVICFGDQYTLKDLYLNLSQTPTTF